MTSNAEPRTVALLGQKGGCGKTTLAIHLAVAAHQDGERVVLIDTDPQMSATYWYGERKHPESEEPLVIRATAHQLREALDAAREDGFTLCIIDTPPHAVPAAAKAIEIADFVLMPCRPTALDMRATTAAVAIARASGKPHAFVLNACPYRSPEIEEARGSLTREFNIPVFETAISDRRPFFRALAKGRSVTEFEPKGRAADEIRSLWGWTKAHITLAGKVHIVHE